VARTAGVSTASASRALTRPELVSDSLRDQIVNAARELAYVPNAAARSLSGRPARLVGVVVGGLSDPIVVGMLDALARRLAADGIALLLAIGADTTAETAQRVRELLGRGVDAILFGGGAVPVPRTAGQEARRLPWASLDSAEVEERCDAASGFNRAQGHALAMRYLHDLGHRRIGLIASGDGRQAAAVRAALGVTDITVADGSALGEAKGSVGECLSRLLAQPAPPTALVCDSDDLAARMLGECERQGIAVPQRMAVVGFGDTELARHTRPALTTVRVPAREAGIAAAEYVLAVLAGLPIPEPRLAVRLVARQSSGPAPR